MGDTKIPWATKTWNVTEGCSKVSPGCKFCYGERLAPRLGVDFSKVTVRPERLEEPLHWRKPQRVFVCSRSDLFHDEVPRQFIVDVFRTMFDAKQHTYLLLTKRPYRMKELWTEFLEDMRCWPSPRHVWLGVSCENQEQLIKRWPYLKDTPAAVRFISFEPLLSDIIFPDTMYQDPEYPKSCMLDLAIIGGESGPHHRPMEIAWLRSIVNQCKAAGVKVWVKQASHARPGQQGDIPDELWALKQTVEV